MPKFRALNDTYYRYSFVRKGEEIDGGAELYKSRNFEALDGKKGTSNTAAGSSQPVNGVQEPTYKELQLLAKGLGINGYNRMSYPDLAAAVAQAQVAKATPDVNGDDKDNNTGGDSAGDDGNAGDTAGDNAGGKTE